MLSAHGDSVLVEPLSSFSHHRYEKNSYNTERISPPTPIILLGRNSKLEGKSAPIPKQKRMEHDIVVNTSREGNLIQGEYRLKYV